MQKIILTYMLILAGNLASFAQFLSVNSFEVESTDITAKQDSNNPKDRNGKHCALLKIWTMDDITQVQGNNLGRVKQQNEGEKWIYMTEGSKKVELAFKKHLPMEIVFMDYNKDIKRLKSNITYRLVLSEGDKLPIPSSVSESDSKSISAESISLYEEGFKYLKGFDKYKQDIETAKNLFFKSADLGNPDAQFYLGCMYAEGIGFDQNYKEALKWKGLAADQNHREALFDLSRMYANGLGVNKDPVMEFYYLSKSAELGFPKALNNLAILYKKGADFGNGIVIEKDFQKAAEYFQQAADRGDAIGLYNLAQQYYKGHGVEMDSHKALELYEKAAKLGDEYAQYNAGLLLLRGDGVPVDKKRGIKYLKQAADQGHENAIMALLKLGKL